MPARKRKPQIASVEDYQHALALTMPEDELLQNVLDTFRRGGFIAYHTHNSQRSAPGFPDVVAIQVAHGRLVVVETKREMPDNPTPAQLKRFNPTPEQVIWLQAFAAIYAAESYVWRPSDWLNGTVERVILQRAAA